MNDKIKTIITAAIVIAALYFVYALLLAPAGEVPASPDEFLGALNSTNQVFIIMDLRGAPDNIIRNNIMQCGTDFAGSQGLTNKTITSFAFEGDKCTTMQGIKSVDTCLEESKNGVSIVITSTVNMTTYYKNKVKVLIGPIYKTGTCGVQKYS